MENASTRILKPWKEILGTMGYGNDGRLCLWLSSVRLVMSQIRRQSNSLLNKALELRSQSNSGLTSLLHFVNILQSF